MANRRILIVGGGTGGHLFPAMAIGEEIQRREPDAIIHYIGSIFGLESKVFPIKDVWHTLLPIRGLQRGFSAVSIFRNILLPFRIIRSLIKTNRLLKEFVPEILIGTGGYASAIPLYIGAKKDIPIILQEQNSFPGLTTRWFANKAERICIAFDESQNVFNSNTVLTGNPVRKGIEKGDRNNGIKEFSLKKNNKTIFLFGGSQGSAYLNKMMSNVAKKISSAGIQVLWQTGDLEYVKYRHMESENIRIVPFVNNMADAYAISDLLVCRSGALTLAEITVSGKPAILIPFPHAAGDHQTKNAQALVNFGAAQMLHEKSLNSKILMHTIMNLIHNKEKLERMALESKKLGRPNATIDIVDQILDLGVEI
jgi:UDP-N-acetylglucosamine--N-acetylmuramyl-(pentapeptide) pyrophosphoryl-undecaprenol N-acetylglucosamine transferase